MTIVSIDLRQRLQDGSDVPYRRSSMMYWTPWLRRVEGGFIAGEVVTPVKLEAAVGVFDAPAGTVWRVEEPLGFGPTRWVNVGSDANVNYSDLPSIDPKTLLPGPSPLPGWADEVTGLIGLATDAKVSAEEAAAAAVETLASKADIAYVDEAVAAVPGATDSAVAPLVSAPMTKAALDGQYAQTGTVTHQPIKAEIKRSKGGVIGTNGKAAVAIRIDHGMDQFLSTIWPLLKARNIPCGIGVVSDCMENPADPYEPTSTTWATLLTNHKDGFEIWDHSATHRDPGLTGNSIKYEVEDSKAKIESHGLRVMGFQMPGITPTIAPDYSSQWDPATSWKSQVGQRILANYGLIEVNGSIGGSRRWLPTDGCYDLGHYTLDGLTYAQAKVVLDAAIANGFSSEWMIHPRFVVTGTVLHSVTDFTNFVNYLVTLRDAGTIELLTPSGLAFASPDTARRLNPLIDPGFESTATVTTSTAPWTLGGASLPVSIGTDGGHAGTKYLLLPSTAGFSYVQQGIDLSGTGMPGTTMQVEAWVRCVGANTEASIAVSDSATPANLTVQKYTNIIAGSGWQRIWCVFTIPLVTAKLSVRLARRLGSGEIHFDDVRLTPI